MWDHLHLRELISDLSLKWYFSFFLVLKLLASSKWQLLSCFSETSCEIRLKNENLGEQSTFRGKKKAERHTETLAFKTGNKEVFRALPRDSEASAVGLFQQIPQSLRGLYCRAECSQCRNITQVLYMAILL